MLKLAAGLRIFGRIDPYYVSSYSYNARGQLDTIVDPAGYTTVQLYNGFGQPRFKTKPASKRTIEAEWSYDELGRQVKHTVKGGVDLGYRYDGNNGRLLAIVQGDPADNQAPLLQDFEYDELGRWGRATHYNVALAGLLNLKPADREVRLTRTYDDANRRYTETSQVGQQSPRTVQVEWTLDVANTWLRNVTLPDGRIEVEGHDGDGRQTDLTRAGGGTTTFAWVDELLAETSSSKPGAPLKRTVTYDGLAQPRGRCCERQRESAFHEGGRLRPPCQSTAQASPDRAAGAPEVSARLPTIRLQQRQCRPLQEDTNHRAPARSARPD